MKPMPRKRPAAVSYQRKINHVNYVEPDVLEEHWNVTLECGHSFQREDWPRSPLVHCRDCVHAAKREADDKRRERAYRALCKSDAKRKALGSCEACKAVAYPKEHCDRCTWRAMWNRRKRAWELRQGGLTWAAVGARIGGVSASCAAQTAGFYAQRILAGKTDEELGIAGNITDEET